MARPGQAQQPVQGRQLVPVKREMAGSVLGWNQGEHGCLYLGVSCVAPVCISSL